MTITSLLSLLFSTFPPQQGDVKAQMAAIAIAVDGYDVRDIEAAVRAIVRGETDWHNKTWAPSAALLSTEIRKRMDRRLRLEQYDRPRLPPPDVPKSAASRDRVLARMAETVGHLDAVMSADDVEQLAASVARAKRVAARFAPDQDPDAMAKRLNLRTEHYWTAGDKDSEDAA
jgi:hypothetical protein